MSIKEDIRNKLSIIIVNYNTRDYLKKCLQSIYKNLPAELKNFGWEWEIIVVDNASSDDSILMVKKNFPDVKVIENSRNLGFATANNLGIKSTSSEYLLLLNSDCEIFKDSIINLICFMDKNPDVGIVGPKILNSDGSIQFSCRKFPSFLDASMHSLIGSFYPNNPFSKRYMLVEKPKNEPFLVDWVSGSCMFIRRQALKDTGLMDEKYFMYVEDTDLCFQMWRKNWKVYYLPYSEVLHHIGKSTIIDKKSKITSSIIMQKSAAYFFLKNYKNSWKVILFPLIIIVLSLRILLTLIKNLFK